MRESGGALTLRVRVQPRSTREAISAIRGGVVHVRLTAPPVEGAANQALVRFLGRVLGLPPSRLEVVRGTRGRDKVLRLVGADGEDVEARLRAACPEEEGER